jgi:photosystem II stability/assembly factor-like uncharacterized protein/tetratricopeptide (TPR) repeat protein
MNNILLINRKISVAIVYFTVVFSHILFSQENSTWTNLNGPRKNTGATDVSLGTDENNNKVIYVADNNVLIKSTDNGLTWRNTNHPIDTPLVISVNSNNPDDQIVVGTNNTISFSSDGGNSFLTEPQDIAPARISRARSDNDITYVGLKYVNVTYPLKKSGNGGASISDVNTFNYEVNVNDIAIHPENSDTIWVGTSSTSNNSPRGFFYNLNGSGEDWTHVADNAVFSANITSVALSKNDENGNYKKFGGGGSKKKFYRNVDTGWTAFSPPEFGDGTANIVKALRVLTDGKLIAAVYGAGVFVSTDDGSTWTGMNTGLTSKNVKNLVINPNDEEEWYLATTAGVFRKEHGSTTWSLLQTLTSITSASSISRYNNTIYTLTPSEEKRFIPSSIGKYIGGNDTGMWHAYPGFSDNIYIGKGIDSVNGKLFTFGRFLVPRSSKKTKYYRQAVIMTIDTNDTWKVQYLSPAINSKAIVNGITRWDGKYYAYGFFASQYKKPFLESNNGSDWTEVGLGFKEKSEILKMVGVGNNIFVKRAKENGVWIGSKTNGSVTWSSNNSLVIGGNSFSLSDVKSIVKTEANCVYFGTSSGFYIYKNNAWHFGNKLGNIKQVAVYSPPVGNDTVFVIRSVDRDHDEILRSNNLGNLWFSISNDLPASIFSQIVISADGKTIIAATNNGVYRRNINASGGTPVTPTPSASNLQTSIVWNTGEQITINENYIVESGSTLTVEEGVSISVAFGKKIIVNGSIMVLGTETQPVTISSEVTGENWQGIYISNEGNALFENTRISDARIGIFSAKGNTEMSNTTITSCIVGAGFYGMSGESSQIFQSSFLNNAWGIVCLNGADVVLKNNLIANGQKGILIDASSPLLFGNEIKDNVQVGVVIYGGGYPRFGDIANDKPGLNIVQGNDLTQILAVKGYAFLGYLNRDCVTGLGGGNIISNTNPDAPLCVTVEQSRLVAMQTDWGLATVTPDDFIYDNNSEIIFHCLLQETQTEQERLLWEALEARGAGVYRNAIEKYQAILRDYGQTNEAMQALAELHQTYRAIMEQGTTPAIEETVRTYLQSLLAFHPNEEIRRSATILLALDYGRWEEGFETFERFEHALILELDADTRISTLLSQMLYERCDMEYEDDAYSTLVQLRAQFPNDERTQLAQQILKMVNGELDFSGYGKRTMFNVAMREFPKKNPFQKKDIPKIFSLEQNYPNPFNPVTVIRYQLPVNSFVTLKVYDILGREAAMLVNNEEAAGYKVVRFDASRLSSGIYFYKLHAGNFQQMKKLLLVK